MANRNTAIRGVQIRDGEITATQLATAVNASLALADSAVQPGDLPSFGDIVTHDVSEFATSAQGALADTALQSLAFAGLDDGCALVASKYLKVNVGGTAIEMVDLPTDIVGITEANIAVEDLTGNADTSLVLADSPVANSVQLYINGLLQEAGTGKDYTIADDTITLVVATEADDIIIVHYIIAV